MGFGDFFWIGVWICGTVVRKRGAGVEGKVRMGLE